MAQQTYDVDAAFVVQPPSGLYNSNSSGVVASGTGTSALANYSVTSQNLSFQFYRQNLIIPNGTYFDPNVTHMVGLSSFACQATNNRIIVQGAATYTVQIIPSTIFSVSSARIPQTFQAFGAASGVSGNGLYTSGFGWVQTLQPGYIRQVASSTSATPVTITRSFTIPIYLRSGGWNQFAPVSDPVNTIITEICNRIKAEYIPEFRTDLLFV